MSKENVETVRRCFEAYLAGDFTTVLSAVDPDVEFDVTVRPDGRVFRGAMETAEGISLWTEAWTDYRIRIDDVLDAGDRVLVVAQESGRAKGSKTRIDQRSFSLFTVRDDRIVRWQLFLDKDEALEAAGLSD